MQPLVGTEVALCRFEPKPGREHELEAALENHYGTLRRHGLVRERPHALFRGEKEDGAAFYVEVIPWNDAAAAARAHDLPDVMAIWDAMGEACTFMEFPHATVLELS